MEDRELHGFGEDDKEDDQKSVRAPSRVGGGSTISSMTNATVLPAAAVQGAVWCGLSAPLLARLQRSPIALGVAKQALDSQVGACAVECVVRVVWSVGTAVGAPAVGRRLRWGWQSRRG